MNEKPQTGDIGYSTSYAFYFFFKEKRKESATGSELWEIVRLFGHTSKTWNVIWTKDARLVGRTQKDILWYEVVKAVKAMNDLGQRFSDWSIFQRDVKDGNREQVFSNILDEHTHAAKAVQTLQRVIKAYKKI